MNAALSCTSFFFLISLFIPYTVPRLFSLCMLSRLIILVKTRGEAGENVQMDEAFQADEEETELAPALPAAMPGELQVGHRVIQSPCAVYSQDAEAASFFFSLSKLFSLTDMLSLCPSSARYRAGAVASLQARVSAGGARPRRFRARNDVGCLGQGAGA